MSNRTYDILKFIAQIVLPALGALYFGLSRIWGLPYGEQDAYMTGDKVHYPGENDPVYVSTVDNNTWAPNVYGWEVEA